MGNDDKNRKTCTTGETLGEVVPFPGPRTGGLRTGVLVVDDDPQVLRVMLRILDRTQFKVRTAMTHREALAAIEAEPPEFVLLDLHLTTPQCADGLAVLSDLRAAGYDGPIFMLSADPSIEQACRAARRGANGYLVKSDPERFLERLNTLLMQSVGFTSAHTLPPSAEAYFETRGLSGKHIALLTELTRSFGEERELAASLRWRETEVRERFREICDRLGARNSTDLGRIIGVLSCFSPLSERIC